MRILITTATYPPTVNGVAYHVQLLFNSLTRLGHKTLVLAPDHHQVDLPEAGIIRYPSFTTHLLENYPIGIPLISIEKIKRFKPEIIHAHHPLIIGALSTYLANKFSIPLFFTNHTRYQEYINYYLPIGTKITERIFNHHLKSFAQKTQKVICPSSTIKNYLKSLNINNTVVIPNGIDLVNFQPQNNQPSNLNLIFVGRLEKEKNLFQLINLARELKNHFPQFRLTIVGSGSLYQPLQTKINSTNLSSNVHLTGLVPRNKLCQLLNQHHFFVSLSTSEVMPLTYLEAQACGLPTIIPKNSGLTDFLNSGNSITIPKNLKKATDIIDRSYQNKNEFQKLSLNSIKNSQKYSSQNTARRLINLYQKHIQ